MKRFNKKGDEIDPLIIVFTILILLFFFALILILVRVGEKERGDKITEDSKKIDENIFLLTYLRSPAGDSNIAELISKSLSEDDYAELRTETDLIIRRYYGEDACWRIKINDEAKADEKGACLKWDEVMTVKAPLPNLHNIEKEPILLELTIW